MTTTPHLALPLIAAAQAQKHVTHNEALFAVDALLHCAVKDKDLAAPPASPAEGDRYIVAGAATGAWAGKTGHVAARQDGAWRFYPPQAGWIAFVVDELQLYHFNGTAWAAGVVAITNLQNLTLLGIGTAADATNSFSAKLNNELHAAKTIAEGGTGNIQVKLSKENAAKSASHLFQTNFSGRAELGLTGDDNLHLKVSADGSTWFEGLSFARASVANMLNVGGSYINHIYADNGATGPTFLTLHDSTSPAANDTVFRAFHDGRDSSEPTRSMECMKSSYRRQQTAPKPDSFRGAPCRPEPWRHAWRSRPGWCLDRRPATTRGRVLSMRPPSMTTTRC